MAEFKLGRLKFVWKGDWATSTSYVRDDIIRFGGRTYVCTSAHTSSDFQTSLTAGKWQLHTEGLDFKGAWTTSTQYKVRDIVVRGGNTYTCTVAHTSASTNAGYNSTDSAKWTVFTPGFNWRGVWTATTYYAIGDIVKDGANTYICTTDHTSDGTHLADYANWEHFTDGFQFEDSWNDASPYEEGDVVTYGGYIYTAITHNTNSNPSTNPSDWAVFTTGFALSGDWTSSTTYKIGNVVRYGGNVYVAKEDVLGVQPPSDASKWDLLVSGFNWRAAWSSSSVTYRLGDVVKRGLSSYICIADHTSAGGNDPQLDQTKWTSIAEGDSSDVLASAGDLLIRGATGAERLPIGSPNQVLIVDPLNNIPEWSSDLSVNNIDGGGNLDFDGQLFLGPNAATEVDGGAGTYSLTNARAILKSNVDDFAQIGIINANDGDFASTDLIAYSSNGNNDSGWIDLGITSENFDITSGYGITGKNDGYLFMSAPAGTTGTGNLVIATDVNGSENDIIFVTGGFDPALNPNYEKMRLIGTDRVINGEIHQAGVEIKINTAATSPTTGALRVEGGIGLTGDLYAQGNVVVQGNVQIYGGSEQFSAENLVVTNPIVFVGDTNPDDLYDLGFVGEYSNRTLLDGAINASVTTITVDSTSIFPTSGTLLIGAEQITYTGKTSTTFTGCTRGANSTTAASHADNTPAGLTRYSGLVRNHNDRSWNFIDHLTQEPSTTTNFADPNLTFAKLKIGSIEIKDTTDTSSFDTGAFTVQGGMGVKGDIYAGGKGLFGNDIGGGAMGGATNPIGQFIADDDNYAQVYIFNRNAGQGASADLIAYPDNGTDAAGFVDIGITSSTFDYAAFAITGANEGYVFMSAPDNTTSGNLIIATDATGTENAIKFYTGGFDDLDNIKMSIDSTTGVVITSEVVVDNNFNVTAAAVPTSTDHLTNKQYTDSNFNSVVHAVLYDPLTGEMVYTTESKTTAGTISMDFKRFDMAFINNSQSTVSLNSSGHLLVTLA